MAFAFGPDGACVRNSYGTAPPRAKLASLPVREINGMIFAWYHTSGVNPTWQVPAIDTSGFPKPSHWVKKMCGHPLDLCENSIDLGHFAPLHNGARVKVLESVSTANHHLKVKISFAGFYYLSRLRAEFSIEMFGVGYLAVKVTFPQLRLNVFELCSWTPIDPGQQQFYKTTYAKVGTPEKLLVPLRKPVILLCLPIAKIVSLGSVQQIKIDEKIWRHRQYVMYPKLAAGDGPIMLYRRWAEQFFEIDQESKIRNQGHWNSARMGAK